MNLSISLRRTRWRGRVHCGQGRKRTRDPAVGSPELFVSFESGRWDVGCGDIDMYRSFASQNVNGVSTRRLSMACEFFVRAATLATVVRFVRMPVWSLRDLTLAALVAFVVAASCSDYIGTISNSVRYRTQLTSVATTRRKSGIVFDLTCYRIANEAGSRNLIVVYVTRRRPQG
jgi:hypothetical protein